jgi:uncharacterized protein
VPAVSNSSPLILYAGVGRLELLGQLFDRIVIPRAVHDEIVGAGAGRPGATQVAAASWIDVQDVLDRQRVRALSMMLDAGEAEAIALAGELDDLEAILLDDRRGRRLAHRQGLPVIGSAGALLLAKEQGAIPLVRPLLDQLRSAGLRLGEARYREVLAAAHE